LNSSAPEKEQKKLTDMKPEDYILIVEDSQTQALLLKYLLKLRGRPAEIAISGEEAYEKAKQQRPNLIISDFIMPGMNGIDFCRKVRQDPAIKSVPFILMTAQDDPIDGLETVGRGGPDAFMTKPVDRAQLDQLLKNLCPGQDSVPDSGTGPFNFDINLRVFDSHRLKDNLGGDDRIFMKIIAAFLEECPQRFANLNKALAEGNRCEVELIAHSIKGAATTIGGERLQTAAQAMEKAAASAEFDQLRLMLAQVSREYERLKTELKSIAASDPNPKDKQTTN
jgi:two-component system, chemotaxis family, response regulator PixH